MAGDAGAQRQIGLAIGQGAEGEGEAVSGVADLELTAQDRGAIAARQGKTQFLAGAQQHLATALAKEAAAPVVVHRTDRTDHGRRQVGGGGGAIGIAGA